MDLDADQRRSCGLTAIASSSLPGVHIRGRGIDLLPTLMFPLEKALQLKKVLAEYLIFEMGKPALMQEFDL